MTISRDEIVDIFQQLQHSTILPKFSWFRWIINFLERCAFLDISPKAEIAKRWNLQSWPFVVLNNTPKRLSSFHAKGQVASWKLKKIAQSQKLSRLVGSRGNLSGVISRKVTQVSRDPIFWCVNKTRLAYIVHFPCQKASSGGLSKHLPLPHP